MLMPMGGGVADRLRTISVVNTAVNEATGVGASTITLPSGVRPGDIAILFDYTASNGSNIGSSVLPSGWTSIVELENSGTQYSRLRASYKILTTSDPAGTVITGTNLGAARAKILIVLRGNTKIRDVAVSAISSDLRDGNPPEVSLAPSEIDTTGPSIALASVFSSNLFNSYVFPGWANGSDAGYTIVAGSLIGELGYVLYNDGEAPGGPLVADARNLGLGCAGIVFALNLG